MVGGTNQTDADCVKEVLKYESKYVGMIGSTKKVTAIIKKLKEEGYTEQNIARNAAMVHMSTKNGDAANQFLQYLKSDEAMRVFEKYGFKKP